MITKKDRNDFEVIISKANNKELGELLILLEKEIMLCETSILEGFEKRIE